MCTCALVYGYVYRRPLSDVATAMMHALASYTVLYCIVQVGSRDVCTCAIVYVRTRTCNVLYVDACKYKQELMSGEAAKERVTTAYTWVPSKSKSLAS